MSTFIIYLRMVLIQTYFKKNIYNQLHLRKKKTTYEYFNDKKSDNLIM